VAGAVTTKPPLLLTVCTRLTPAELRLVQTRARQSGQRPSVFLRELIRDALQAGKR
jgi:hypothetical protein